MNHLNNAFEQFFEDEDNQRTSKVMKNKGQSSVQVPLKRKKASVIARNNMKKGTISIFPGGYHISK